MKKDFEEVITEIIQAINNIHYEDEKKELIKLKVLYVIYKMTQSKKEFDNSIKILDKNRR